MMAAEAEGVHRRHARTVYVSPGASRRAEMLLGTSHARTTHGRYATPTIRQQRREQVWHGGRGR